MAVNTAIRWIQDFSQRLIKLLEQFFYWWGCTVATHPLKVILSMVTFTGICSLGLLNFNAVSDGWDFWLPEGTRHSRMQQWKKDNFIEDTRGTITLFTHEENVLTVEGLLLLLDLHKTVQNVTFQEKNYHNVCMKIPITNILLADKTGTIEKESTRRKRRFVVEERANETIAITSVNDTEYDYYDYMNFYGEGEDLPPLHTNHDTESEERYYDKENHYHNLPKEIYCDIIDTLVDKCGEFSLLEIWKYDKSVISKLRDQDIINAINTVDESPIFGYKTNYTSYLGQVQYNSSGHVVKAKSVRSIWLEQFDADKITKSSKLIGFEMFKADPFTMGYETEVIEVMKVWMKIREKEGKGYALFFNVGRSYSDEASGPIEFDANNTVIGYAFMFLYTMLTLGKFNLVEHKCHMAAAGIWSCLFGCIVGIALSSAIGFTYTSLSGILPFICLGIGIDDMFVIVRCYNNIPESEKKKNGLIKNVGVTMKHAGVSITVTSLTDVFAFCIGAVVSFPALKSFCVAAAIAISTTYLLQSSWLVAWMVLDEHRIAQKRDGIIPFIVYKDWQPSEWTQKDFGNIIMTKMWGIFEVTFIRVIIILLTAAMLAGGIWGSYNIRVSFDVKSFLPQDSYLTKWIHQNNLDFPTDGFLVNFYTKEVPYNLETFEKIDIMVNELDNLTRTNKEWVHYGKKLPKSVNTQWDAATGFWWPELKKYINKDKNINGWRDSFNKGNFPMYLSDFLNHEDGSVYVKNFRFQGATWQDHVSCNEEAPPIKAVKFGTLRFTNLQGPSQHLPAQNAIKTIMDKVNLPNTTFANSAIYPAWEVEEILVGELLQNLCLALLVVMVVVFITLANLRVSLMILSCVVFTTIDALGILYMWGMTLEPFSLMAMIIGIGLSVDYSVHIAHAYIISDGPKKERIKNGFINISPAILQGGMTTFLALIFLCNSRSNLFITFFKINSMIVIFGLFHGLLFLPSILLFFGSDSVDDEDEQKTSKHAEMTMTTYSQNCIDSVSHEDERKKKTKEPKLPISSNSENGIDNPEFNSVEYDGDIYYECRS